MPAASRLTIASTGAPAHHRNALIPTVEQILQRQQTIDRQPDSQDAERLLAALQRDNHNLAVMLEHLTALAREI